MAIIDARDVLNFPPGDNVTDTFIGGVHLNRTALLLQNYTLFSNQTLSNGSWCLIVKEPYAPVYLFGNGTFINATWCFAPLNPIGQRGFTAIGFAVAYGLALLLTLVNLGKHGKRYLPEQKRFWPIGRRWQWYWQIMLCVAAFVGLVATVDVDRYYVTELPIVVASFFWILLNMATIAAVWENVRHWGSWRERQFIDPDPFVLRQDDRRGQFEFWIPLVFYFFLWMDFFLAIPRNWGDIELQRSPDQATQQAEPAATDGRFKGAAFMLFIAWLTTVISLRHSIQHYEERNRGIFNRVIGLVRYIPPRFAFMVPLALATCFYQAFSAWQFDYSPLRVPGDDLAIFLGGYAPPLLITLINCISGFIRPNEDKDLIRQRRVRGIEDDRQLGLTKKPAWWRRLDPNFNHDTSMRATVARNVREIGGGKPTARGVDTAAANRTAERDRLNRLNEAAGGNAGIEMSNMSPRAGARPGPEPYLGRSDVRRSERSMQAAASLLFPSADPTPTPAERREFLMGEGPAPPPYANEAGRGRPREAANTDGTNSLRPGTAGRSNSQTTTNSITNPPVQIRSMLDV